MVKGFTRCFALELALLAACGNGDQDVPDDAVTVDAAPRCDPTKPFSTTVPMTELNSDAFEHGADLSPDELEIYFASDRTGSFDIYRATRTSPSASFGAPESVAINTVGSEIFPRVSRDRLTLIFKRAPTTSAPGDLYMASRATPTDPFTFANAVALMNVNSTDDDTMPSLSADEQTLYLTSDRTGFTAGTNLFRSVRDGSGTFQAPTVVSELSSDSSEASMILINDGLGAYFTSDRPGTNNAEDIWYASRTSTTDAFTNITNVVALATQYVEMPLWISADNCELLFSSNRPGGKGGTDLWMASRPK